MNRRCLYLGGIDGPGDIRILNVLAGEHDSSIWHERPGQLQAHATVPLNGDAAVTFECRQYGSDYEHRERVS